MKRARYFLSAVVVAAALLAPVVANVSPASATTGSSFPCESWSVDTPYSGFGVIGSEASASCIVPQDFGNVYIIIKLWQYDGHYHNVAANLSDVPCKPFLSFAVCTGSVSVTTGLYPPNGTYHAELEVQGALESEAPGFYWLDDANSGHFCQHC